MSNMKSDDRLKNCVCGAERKKEDSSELISEGTEFSGVSFSSNDECYKSFFRKNHVVMLIVDPENGAIFDANDAACSFYGYSLEEIRKKKIFDINTDAVGNTKANMQRAVSKSGKEFVFEHRLASGELRKVRAYSGKVYISRKAYLYTCIFDITEHFQTQRQLIESEDKFKSLYVDAPVPYQSLDGEGNFLEINESFCKTLGYEKEDLIGHNFSEILHPDWKAHFIKNFPRFKAVGEIMGVEFELRKKDGSYVLVSFTGKIGRHHDGSFKQTHCVFRDITGERENLITLIESEYRFRRLFEDLEMVAVQGYDEERRVIFWNRSSELLYGYSSDEALGNRLEDLIVPDHMRQQVVNDVNRWLNEGTSIPSGEIILQDRDGNPVPVYSSHVMQVNHAGQKEMYCIDVDLTEIKRANVELVRAKHEAEKANRAKSLFLANMSHELRTPLNGIMGMHRLLKGTRLDHEQEKYVDGAVASAKRLTALLGDVLDLSRIESGKTVLAHEQFNLRETLTHTRELFIPACMEKGLELVFHIDENLPEMVCGDQIRLVQVVSNLLGNSIKFTEIGFVGCEVYYLRDCGNSCVQVLFIVSDSGIGISDDELYSIFEVFAQGEQSYVRKYQGAGLGLSIARKLTEMMDGSLCFDSVKEIGTKVYFSVPLEVGAMSEELGVKVDDACASDADAPARVLLVEDEAINRLSMQKLLEKYELEVVCAENGREALSLLSNQDFDVVLMDIQMPVMDGLEAARRIRSGEAGEHRRDVRIVALTAYAMAGDRERFIDAGMDEYLTKPVEVEDLMKVLT